MHQQLHANPTAKANNYNFLEILLLQINKHGLAIEALTCIMRAVNVSLTSVGRWEKHPCADASNELTGFFSDFEKWLSSSRHGSEFEDGVCVCLCMSNPVCTVCEKACICNFGCKKGEESKEVFGTSLSECNWRKFNVATRILLTTDLPLHLVCSSNSWFFYAENTYILYLHRWSLMYSMVCWSFSLQRHF